MSTLISLINSMADSKMVKQIPKRIHIPVIYAWFLILLVISTQTSFLNSLKIQKYFPKNICNAFISLIDSFYQICGNPWVFFSFFVFSLGLINFASSKWAYELKSTETAYGEWRAYSAIAAIKRLTRFVIWIAGSLWIIKFSIKLLMQSETSVGAFAFNNFLTGDTFFFWGNVCVMAWYCLRALFLSEGTNTFRYNTSEELEANFISINHKSVSSVNFFLAKGKFSHSKDFYLFEEIKNSSSKRQTVTRKYKIIDSDKNFSVIRYHFDHL